MKEDWTTSRVIGLLLTSLLIAIGVFVLMSLERQQEMIVDLRQSVDEMKRAQSAAHAPREITVRLDGAGVLPVARQDHPAATAPAGPTGTPAPAAAVAGAKDAIGRPLRLTPGFTMEPPLGTEFPGLTQPRTPEFIPPLQGTLVTGITSDPQKVNYYLTNDGVTSRYIDAYIHERLFTIDPDDPSRIVPDLAVAWETSDDKLTYRIHLRKGVVFSDGSPFDAGDVVFSFQTILDPTVQSDHLRSGFTDVDSLVALDDHTIEVRMKRPYWKALKQLGYNLRPLSRRWFETAIPAMAAARGLTRYSVSPGQPGFGDAFNLFTRDVSPGTGPYAWRVGESWVPGQHITLFPNMRSWHRALNPDYHRIARLRYRIIKDRVTQHQEFLNGKIDLLVVDHDAWDDQLSKDPTIARIANHYEYDHIGILYSYIIFNCRRPPFDDPAVRRAVAHLMDRKSILEKLERGRGGIPTCPSKPIYPTYSHDLVPHAFDVDRARAILAEAGWRDTDGDGLLDKDGRPLEFRLSVPAGRVWYITVSTLLQEAAASAGVRVRADNKDWAVFTDEIDKLEFQATCLYASASDPWIDPFEAFHSSQIGPQAGNVAGWVNAEVDALLEAMRAEFDDDRRNELFDRVNHLFHEELPWLLLHHGKVGVLLNQRVKGAKVRPTGLRNFDMWISDAGGE